MPSPAVIYSFPAPSDVFSAERKLSEEISVFKALLKKWGRVHNLTAALEDEEINKHIKLSIALAFVVGRELPSATEVRLADVGSGAGFPGLFVALYFERVEKFDKNVFGVDLYEVRKKRVAFLKRVSYELGLKCVSIVPERFSCFEGRPYQIVMGRAVMPPEDFAGNFSKCAGKIIYMGSERLWEGYKRFYRSRLGTVNFWAGVFDAL